jgi:hypothetical protein
MIEITSVQAQINQWLIELSDDPDINDSLKNKKEKTLLSPAEENGA